MKSYDQMSLDELFGKAFRVYEKIATEQPVSLSELRSACQQAARGLEALISWLDDSDSFESKEKVRIRPVAMHLRHAESRQEMVLALDEFWARFHENPYDYVERADVNGLRPGISETSRKAMIERLNQLAQQDQWELDERFKE